ncbi:MAG: hypothetical protein Kow0026_12270 [Oricola sp.]
MTWPDDASASLAFRMAGAERMTPDAAVLLSRERREIMWFSRTVVNGKRDRSLSALPLRHISPDRNAFLTVP